MIGYPLLYKLTSINNLTGKETMSTYKCIVRVGLHTVDTQVVANNDIAAKQLLEAQYGQGNVVSYWRVND
jgi:hypothetical protein